MPIGGKSEQVGFSLPHTATARGIHAVTPDELHTLRWDMLGKLGDEIPGGEELEVLFEVLIVVGVKRDLSTDVLEWDLPQCQGCSGDVLGYGLAQFVVVCSDADGAIHAKAGVPPAQQIFGGPLVKQIAFKEELDDAAAEALAHAGLRAEGNVDESALGIESAFDEQAMPVRVPQPELSESLVGYYRPGLNWVWAALPTLDVDRSSRCRQRSLSKPQNPAQTRCSN